MGSLYRDDARCFFAASPGYLARSLPCFLVIASQHKSELRVHSHAHGSCSISTSRFVVSSENVVHIHRNTGVFVPQASVRSDSAQKGQASPQTILANLPGVSRVIRRARYKGS